MVQVNGKQCFVDLQLGVPPVQYYITVPSKALSPVGLLVLGILKAQLSSDELTTPAVHEAPITSADTAIQVKSVWPSGSTSEDVLLWWALSSASRSYRIILMSLHASAALT